MDADAYAGGSSSGLRPGVGRSGGLVGWFFWVQQPFETVFQSISGRLSKREKEERKDR